MAAPLASPLRSEDAHLPISEVVGREVVPAEAIAASISEIVAYPNVERSTVGSQVVVSGFVPVTTGIDPTATPGGGARAEAT
jgi:hypothetical protein